METKALGAFAEYLLIPGHVVRQNLYRKPDNISFDEAAFLEPLACVLHAVELLGIRRKDTVLVIGAGPIGLLHLLYLKTFGAKVLMTGFEEERLRTAKALGAYAVFHPSLTAESVRAVTDGTGADYVFECTGQPQVWEESVAYVRRGGTVVLFGGCPKGTTVMYDTGRLHYDEITLRGAFHYSPCDVKTAFQLLKGHKMDWLAWEDPFLLSRDAAEFKRERENSLEETNKRLNYVLPMIETLTRLSGHGVKSCQA